MSNQINILVTRELSDEQVAYANALGLNPVCEPAIKITFRDNWYTVESALKERDKSVFAFTSQNAVKAFERFVKSGFELPNDMNVYAVGEKTADALAGIGIEAKTPKQQNGTGLAEKILDDHKGASPGSYRVIHFCGDKRRDEMRQTLQRQGIDSKDVVVYRTLLNKVDIPDKEFTGWLFYSPSAVQAVRASGGFQQSGKKFPELFAIGSTTAEVLSIETGRHVHISPEPKTEVFLEFVARSLEASIQQPAEDLPPSKGDGESKNF